MSTAREIYETYQVPPWLQEHQVRVAAVGKLVAEAHREHLDVELIVSTCLLHDIGAIVKFDFSESFLSDLMNPGEREHWEHVQAYVRERYGTKEHSATEAILSELGAEREREIFRKTGFTRLAEMMQSGPGEVRVVQYADVRIGPRGVVSIEERIEDARVRYAGRGHGWFAHLDNYHALSLELQDAVLASTDITPESITDASIAPSMEQLWDYEIA